jgi:hypothetical protein
LLSRADAMVLLDGVPASYKVTLNQYRFVLELDSTRGF